MQHVMQAASGYMMSAVLHTVVKLGVADELAAGPIPVVELAKRCSAHPDALYRVLRPLIAVGMFAEPSPRTIALTAESELLRADHPNSVRNMILWIASRFHFHVWGDLEYSATTGNTAVEHVYGKPCFEVFTDNPEISSTFNAGMTAFSAGIAPTLLKAYDFSGIGTLMDVAGGHGFVLCEILRAYPEMKGILFDIESVVEGAKCRVCDLKMEHRCETIAGDFFQGLPAGADAYYFQHIIHDWPDDKALVILRNCARALQGRNGGKLLVVDSILPERPQPGFTALLDIEMLLMPGGRERTEKELRELFAQAGFEIKRIVPLPPGENFLIEAQLK